MKRMSIEDKIKTAREVDISETAFADKIPKWQIPLIVMFAKVKARILRIIETKAQ